MAITTIDGFTSSNTISADHYVVGYSDTSVGGEKKWKFSTIKSAVLQGYIPTPAANITWTTGSGSPEGVVTAGIGSLYTNTDGGAFETLYVKAFGNGNTGWVAK